MNVSLKPDLQKLIDDRVNSGKYATVDDVIAAAILALEQQEQFGDFQTGELDRLLEEGERSIQNEGLLDGDEAFRMRCERRAQKRKPAP
jgi:antitoxin ParD1/3/4